MSKTNAWFDKERSFPKLFKYLIISISVVMLALSGLSYAARLPDKISTSQTIPATGTIKVAFSPRGGITDMIIQELDSAKKSIKVQAYSFTSSPIAETLMNAHRRGIQVMVILDKSQNTEKYSSATFLSNAGIAVHIDRDFAIAHSKIIIVDNLNIITRSFNFTKAAEERNAENCLIIKGNQQLADFYLENWQWRWNETAGYRSP